MSSFETYTQKRLLCLRYMMKPLVRYCIRHASAFQDFVSVAKELFVEVAEEEILRTTTKVNSSRISAMTGLYRQEVSRIFKEKKAPSQRAPSILSRIIGHWEQSPDFTTAAGAPRLLTYEGDDSEFEQLVASVSKNINPGTMLFELERLGAIIRTKKKVKLVKQLPGIDYDPVAAYELLGADLGDFHTSVEQNASGQQDISNLHLRTEYDNVFLDSLPEIKRWLVEEGKVFHRKARDFLAKLDKDIAPLKEGNDRKGGVRVVLTSFSLTQSNQDLSD